MTFNAEGTVSNGVVPGLFRIFTANALGVRTQALAINSAQIVTLANALPVASGGTNATSASITAFNNITGYTASGATGTTSTNLVFSTSPTLTTPILGVAAATSINFGGSTLSTYTTAGSWTPTFNFSTPGDLSVSYASRTATYTRIGNVVNLTINLTCTPTFTTASGSLSITGLPFAMNASAGNQAANTMFIAGFAYPAAATVVLSYLGPSYTLMALYGITAVGGNPQVNTPQFTTGVAISIIGSLTYLV
jgi:hypothetical protein